MHPENILSKVGRPTVNENFVLLDAFSSGRVIFVEGGHKTVGCGLFGLGGDVMRQHEV